jgi:TonB family protein
MRLLVVGLLCALAATARADDVRAPDAPPPPKPTNIVTKHPKLLQAVAPDYPPAALAAGKQARVKVRIHIDATGTVASVDVLEPVGDGFDEAAVAAAQQYVFEPAEIDGKPAPIAVETTINFVIDQKPDEPPVQPRAAPAQPERHTGPPNHAGPFDAPVTVQGVAVERGTRNKLAGVIVSIAELGLDAITADDGSFFFHGVPPGRYQVLADDPRYDRLSRPIAIASRERVEIRLWMKPKNASPYETVVEGERDTLEVTKRTISRAQMTSIPGTFGDPIRVVETLPGVARAPFGLGLLLIRGSDPEDTGIFVDGHEVPALFHFLGGPSIFNAEMLDSLTLYPGGFPGRFGRFYGGVVALETRETKDDGIHGSAKIDFIDAGAYLRAPITHDLTIAVAGRRSYIDLFLGFILPKASVGTERIVTPVYDDLSVKLDYNLHADGHLSVFFISSHDSLKALQKDLDTMTAEALDSSIDFWRVIASYTRPLAGDLKLTISPAYGVDIVAANGTDSSTPGPFSSLDVVDQNVSYRMRVNGTVGSKVTLDTGLDLLSRVTTYNALAAQNDNIENASGINISPSQLLRGAQTVGLGAYLDLGIQATSRLRLIPSLRVDGYLLDGQDRSDIDPRLLARFKLDDFWSLKAYVGQFTEPPPPEALDRRFGNPNIQLEKAYDYGLGYEWHPDRLWSLDSEIYYVNRVDVVEFNGGATMNPDGTYQYVNFDNGGKNYSYGLEAIIKREITPTLYGWLSYTFSRSKEADGNTWVASTFDEPNVLNAVASWKPGKGFEVGLRYQFASGRPTTPVIGATYDSDAGSYVPVYGTYRSQRIPAFSQLDARIERDWVFERWSLGGYLDCINVMNTKNVEAIEYDYRYRQSAPVTSFPILPTLGVRGTW